MPPPAASGPWCRPRGAGPVVQALWVSCCVALSPVFTGCLNPQQLGEPRIHFVLFIPQHSTGTVVPILQMGQRAQRNEDTCPEPHGKQGAEPGLQPSPVTSQPRPPHL